MKRAVSPSLKKLLANIFHIDNTTLPSKAHSCLVDNFPTILLYYAHLLVHQDRAALVNISYNNPADAVLIICHIPKQLRHEFVVLSSRVGHPQSLFDFLPKIRFRQVYTKCLPQKESSFLSHYLLSMHCYLL